MKALLILCIAGAALAQTPAPAKKAPAPATQAPATTPAPAKIAPPSAALLNSAAWKAKAPDLFRVKFATTHGDFVVEVHRDWAPLGADRFYNLVKAKFLTDSAFYRYSPGFIVQFGVPANPAVTKAWENARIKDDPVKESNKRGTLTFATSGKDSRTNDFFINFKDNGASLDALGFSPLGTVTEGMDIVEGLYSGYGEMKEMGGNGPSQPLVMTQGKPYLDKNFPKLDSIKSATVIFPEPAAPAAKKAAPGATGTTGTATKSATPPAPAKKQ
jgi:peptidyl-prolyl cis-trans isomerase A (cyclophilin A)